MRYVSLLLTSSALLLLGIGSPAMAAPGSSWHIGYYTPSQHGTLLNGDAGAGSGIATMNFTSANSNALLYTDQKVQNANLLGNVNGKTITLNFTVSDPGNVFTYYGEGTASNPCGAPASARLYFETSNAGGFNSLNYWWSDNPDSVVLANGTLSVTATVEPNEWSAFYGETGAANTAAFQQAASNATRFGLSFGGGCFYENGVGTADGLGSLTLTSVKVN